MKTPEKEKEIPRNYFVPNFGEDKDIQATRQHLAKAEKKHKHKLDWERIKAEAKKENGYPKNYKVQNLGMDKDIVDSQKNLKKTEEKMGFEFELDKEYNDFVQEQ